MGSQTTRPATTAGMELELGPGLQAPVLHPYRETGRIVTVKMVSTSRIQDTSCQIIPRRETREPASTRLAIPMAAGTRPLGMHRVTRRDAIRIRSRVLSD